MKFARNVFFGLVMAGVVVFLTSISFAEMAPAAGKDSSSWKARQQAKVKLLEDSAAALQQTNPVLSKKLSDIVNGQTNKSKEKPAKDSGEWKAKHEARVQLFKDAAAALQQSRPDLAKSLQELTVAKHQTEIEKANEEKNEKEEVGETVEPQSEQGERRI
jgi:hypothetical protein